jgi:ABC-type transport system substrate-binding protein
MPEATTRLSALRSNQVDWIEVPPPDAIPSLKSAGYVVSTSRYPHIWPLVLKITPDAPFNDKRVRQAANFAVDRDALVKLLNGTAEPATGFWPKGTPFAGSPELNYTYDPAKAKALLAEAGYGADKPVKVRIQISTSGSGQMLPIPMNEVIQRSMKAAGFDVEFDVVEWGQMLVTFRQGPDNATVQKLHGSNISLVTWDHSMAFRWFHSRNVAPTSSNWGQFKSPAVDALLNEIEVDFSGKEIAPKLAKLNEMLIEEAPWLFIVHDLNPRAFSKKVEGYTPAQSWFTDLTRVTLK